MLNLLFYQKLVAQIQLTVSHKLCRSTTVIFFSENTGGDRDSIGKVTRITLIPDPPQKGINLTVNAILDLGGMCIS